MADEIPIPASLADITPRWVTEVLRADGRLGPDGRAVVLRLRRIGEGVGIMGELRVATLGYEGDAGDAPESVVVKMPSSFEANREQGVALGMYEAEVRFYRELAGSTAVGMPTIHAARIVPGTADFVIVMEDLSHLQLVDQATGMDADQARAATRVLAGIHAAWWDRADNEAMSWIPTTTGERIQMVAQMVPQLVPVFLERFEHRLPHGGADLIRWFGDNAFAAYRTLADMAPMTLIHSDYRVENLLFGDAARDEVVVIDWQGLGRGPGIYDLAYLLGGSMPIEERRNHERSLVDTYCTALAEGGVPYSSDDAWTAYRAGMTVGGLATSVFAGGTLDLANERGFELIATMAERHVAAAIDLDAASLVD